VTVVVRCDPVVRGPDVAPMWPQRSARVTPSLPFVLPDTCSGDAEVRETGVSVADRGEPEAPCWKWHGDGTAGEYDVGSRLAVVSQLGRWVRLVLGHHLPRWRVAAGGAAAWRTRPCQRL
jgi:hypothetical protein